MNSSPVVVKYSNRRRKRPMQRRRYFAGTKKKAAAKKVTEKAETPAEPPKPIITEDIQAQYKFTPDEIAHMERELRGKLNQLDLLEDQKKAAMQDFKLRTTNVENEAKMLRNKLDAGEETRPMRAHVEYDAKRGFKKFFHPETHEFIQEQPMQPADWQHPMFKPEEVANEATGAAPPPAPVPKPRDVIAGAKMDYPDEKKLKGHFDTFMQHWPAQYPGKKKDAFKRFVADIRDCVDGKEVDFGGAEEKGQGTTNIGDALNQAAAGTQVSPIVLDLAPEDYEVPGLLAAFRRAAKTAKWNPAQIKLLADELLKLETVDKMKETLRPFVKTPASNQPPQDDDHPPM